MELGGREIRDLISLAIFSFPISVSFCVLPVAPWQMLRRYSPLLLLATTYHFPSHQRIMPCGLFRVRAKQGKRRPTHMIERLPMEIKVRESGDVAILEVHGRLTIGEPSEQLYGALQSVMKKGTRKVIVALNSAPQIDSSGLSTLVRISIQLAREGGVLRLVCGPGRVRDALTVTRLVEAIPTFDTESAALANFA